MYFDLSWRQCISLSILSSRHFLPSWHLIQTSLIISFLISAITVLEKYGNDRNVYFRPYLSKLLIYHMILNVGMTWSITRMKCAHKNESDNWIQPHFLCLCRVVMTFNGSHLWATKCHFLENDGCLSFLIPGLFDTDALYYRPAATKSVSICCSGD